MMHDVSIKKVHVLWVSKINFGILNYQSNEIKNFLNLKSGVQYFFGMIGRPNFETSLKLVARKKLTENMEIFGYQCIMDVFLFY